MALETKICINCNKEQAIVDFPLFSTKEGGRKNTCKLCSRRLSKIRRKLRAENPPPPPGPCPICGKHTEKWILDHCHFVNTFRGYICNRCNLGMGNFNDDINIMMKAVSYLEKPVKLPYNDIMDYLLVYKDENGEKRAAIPDVEGVYRDSIEFPEYTHDLTTIEVVVMQSENFNEVISDPDNDGLYFEAAVAGKFVASQRITKCIKKMGFEKFFTSIIKEHLKREEEIDDPDIIF